MSNPFFDHPILNSPYEQPMRHWELDADGQPTQQIVEVRRRADFITPIPKPRKRKRAAEQEEMVFHDAEGISTPKQEYDPTSIINQLRQQLDQWRNLPNPSQWGVTPETARLLEHWRNHEFNDIRPFFCQIEAIETVIWLTEVAPQTRAAKGLIEHLANANSANHPDLMRLALKMATGAGKTTVMAMLIAWQTINAARSPQSKKFTRGFLVVHAPPLFIQEKVHPKVLIDDLLRHSSLPSPSGSVQGEGPACPPQAGGEGEQLDLFADFNGLAEGVERTEFYQHDANWTNRLILGDSLQVMASLAEREGLRGQVQCIYIDPPYGIKFNSNFQWSTTSRDVKDGKADHITREPEQVKAFRDTWRDGVHSYLTYLRDRLTVARDLLADTGSIFVQIGDDCAFAPW